MRRWQKACFVMVGDLIKDVYFSESAPGRLLQWIQLRMWMGGSVCDQ